MKLEVKDLNFQYNHKHTLKHIHIHVEPKSFVGIVGPNGSGKSTLLKNIYRVLKPDQGVILLNEESLHQMTYKKSSQLMSVVGQENEVTFDFKVEEIVKMGRTPYKKLFELDNQEDQQKVYQSLKQVGLQEYAKKNYSELSGGEKQRVLLARALCQNAELFILDEPTNHLDIYYQLQIFDFIKKLDLTVLSAVHDLNIACQYCDYIYILKDGQIYDYGKPEEILTPQVIYDVFHVSSEVNIHPLTKRPHITFLPNF